MSNDRRPSAIVYRPNAAYAARCRINSISPTGRDPNLTVLVGLRHGSNPQRAVIGPTAWRTGQNEP
jgi:hypothetical protein